MTAQATARTTLDSLLPPRFDDDEEERDWYTRHVPCLALWLDQSFPGRGVDRDMARFACSTLLWAPVVRAMGPTEWGRSKEPYCWDDVDAFELIHESLGHGLMQGWDYPLLVEYLRRAVMQLIDAGLIPAKDAEPLVTSMDEWIPRSIDADAKGVILAPDGALWDPHRPRKVSWRIEY